MPLRVRDDLHWCDCLGCAVFLDLAADRYFCLSSKLNDAFLAIAAKGRAWEDSSQSLSLVERGILVDEDSGVGSPKPVNIESVTSDFWDDQPTRIAPLHIIHAILSEIRASRLLHSRSLQQTIKIARRDPCERRDSVDAAHKLESIVAAANVAAFFTRSHDRCLVRAIAVHGVCKKKGINSKLVFGVIAKPFAAHCWVQFESSVLVGSFEQARLYTPIMVVE